jgi:hypothetical protein
MRGSRDILRKRVVVFFRPADFSDFRDFRDFRKTLKLEFFDDRGNCPIGQLSDRRLIVRSRNCPGPATCAGLATFYENGWPFFFGRRIFRIFRDFWENSNFRVFGVSHIFLYISLYFSTFSVCSLYIHSLELVGSYARLRTWSLAQCILFFSKKITYKDKSDCGPHWEGHGEKGVGEVVKKRAPVFRKCRETRACRGTQINFSSLF